MEHWMVRKQKPSEDFSTRRFWVHTDPALGQTKTLPFLLSLSSGDQHDSQFTISCILIYLRWSEKMSKKLRVILIKCL